MSGKSIYFTELELIEMKEILSINLKQLEYISSLNSNRGSGKSLSLNRRKTEMIILQKICNKLEE